MHLIADLGQVDFLDSTGLGVLVGGLKRLREDGGSFALMITIPRILRIFQITGLTKEFASWPSVTDAITADPHWHKTAESQADADHTRARPERPHLSAAADDRRRTHVHP